MKKYLHIFDKHFINLSIQSNTILARISIFIVYFWFGILKVLGFSPAGPVVKDLLNSSIPFMNPDQFVIYFGAFEVLIGIIFLIPQLSRLAIFLLFIHLITTAGPLILLPNLTWQNFLIPTLEGQYIIKNVLIIATAITITASIPTWSKTKTNNSANSNKLKHSQ